MSSDKTRAERIEEAATKFCDAARCSAVIGPHHEFQELEEALALPPDPATLDEMDEWLLQHCGCVDSLRYRSGCTAVARREDPHLVGLRVWQVAYGSTRNEAHARLVVAVKEAMP